MAPIVPTVPQKEYRHAPFLTDDALMDMLQEIDGVAINLCSHLAFAPHQDAEITEAPLIPLESVLRMRVDRGDFPYSAINFESYNRGIPEWGDWVSYLLADPSYCKLLEKCGLYRMVERFNELVLGKHNDALVKLVARWSTHTHTFVAIWGVFTVTVKDVVQLLGLEPIGDVDYFDNLDEVDHIVECLQAWFSEAPKFGGLKGKSTSKTSFNQWQRLCFRESTSGNICEGNLIQHKYHFATFLLSFLSRFIAPGRATDCPRKCLFRMAAILSLGHQLPLAQFFLGNLYYQLDEIHSTSARSGGRFDVGSNIQASFLMMFMYERFKGFCPKAQLSILPKVNCPFE